MITEKGAAGGGLWRIVHESGAAGQLHAASADALNDPSPVRTARFCSPVRPALVLGSHQSEESFDRARLARAGVDLARRRSGGSAVLVGAGRVLWLDLVIPRGDPLWDEDVGRAAWWVGELWAGALGRGEVWRGSMRSVPWSGVVCFAGIGPGEVTVEGHKMVGVCQRRTSRGALFQTAGLVEWQPEEYLSLMAGPAGSVADPRELDAAAVGFGRAAEEDVKSALLALLMT